MIQRFYDAEEDFSKLVDYGFRHHFLVSLVLIVPIGYTYLAGFIVYKTGKLLTYPIWCNFVKTGIHPES